MKKNKKEQEKILKVITEFIESLELLREALVKALVKVFECKVFKSLLKKLVKRWREKYHRHRTQRSQCLIYPEKLYHLNTMMKEGLSDDHNTLAR